MIRKQELINAIGDLSRDVFSLSIRLSALEVDVKNLRGKEKRGDKLEKAIIKAGAPKRRGRPVGSGKKAAK